MKMKRNQSLKNLTAGLAAVAALLGAPTAFAASQTWTNAPTDANWITAANWIANAVPGALNQTGNSVNNDTATFNSPIPVSGIGGIASPVTPDDATVNGARSRALGSIIFDTANCGAYVFASPSSPALPTAGTPETGILNLCHNGSITMNAAVTNNQTFIVPLYIRLPSSTAGIYNFVNNSTNAATLYITGATNDSANTRGTDFRLGGSNTGTNTVGGLSAGSTTSGANGLTKQGSGTWILAGPNDFRSQTVVSVNQGLLIVKDPAAFGPATSVTVTNGTLQFDGVTLNQASLNLRHNGDLRANGAAAVNGVAVGNQAGTVATVSTLNASDVFTVGTGLAGGSLVSGGAADTVLNTTGSGTVVFSQANTYIGKWAFNAATNQIVNPSALGTGGNANVGAGAILDLTPLGPGVSFIPTTGGLGGSGTGTAVGSTAAAVVADTTSTLDLTSKNVNLTFTPTGFSGDTTHPALVMAQGTLILGGNTFFINNASGAPLGVGTYRLIEQASGSITSAGNYAALVSGSGLVPSAAAEIVVSGGNVDLVVTVYTPKDLVWSGTGVDWNIASAASWLDGVTASVFNNSDNVTFNATGQASPSVNLIGTLAPASVTVDTSANDYTFSGSGQIAGTTSLKKVNPGVLNLQTANTYAGGTVVSNGTVRIGANNAVSSTGAGDVAIYSPGSLDLNGFNNTINGFSGDGAVDVTSGGASTLTVGNNNNNGSFSGTLQNTLGALSLVKAGTGAQTLTGANSLAGGVTLSAGTLVAGHPSALGTNTTTVNAGTLEVPNSIFIGGLAGAGGTVANNTTTATNTIVIDGGNTTTYSGSMVNGSGGGGLALTVLSGGLTLAANNTFTGGTIVGSGASLSIANAPAGLGGTLIASNNATLGLSGGSGTPGTPNTVTTADGATVNFTSGALGKIWAAQFVGSANTTNRILNAMSFGGDTSFKSFLGVVRFEATGNARFINIPGGAAGGSDNTTFDFVGATAVATRDPATMRLGHIVGGNSAAGIDQATGGANIVDSYILGGRNLDSTFFGFFRGSNNLVKIGSGKLFFAGAAITTNTDSATYTNYLYGPSLVAHFGNTVISNGTLGLVVPNNLSNTPSITLAGSSAVLDVSGMGLVQDQLDETLTVTNQVLTTNGVLQLYAGQSLSGLGSIVGSVVADAGSTITPGLSIGTLAVSGALTLNATVNMELDRSNAGQNSDRLTAASYAGSGATLNVTNIGATLIAPATFQLFSGPVSAFTTVNLPTTDASGLITYVWQNDLAVDGSIKLTAGMSAAPTPITATPNGGNLE
jgi:autotransporter-associated beta strand protein